MDLIKEETPAVASEEQVSAVTQELLDKQGEIDPMNAAKMVYKYYWPHYKSMVSTLSNKDSRRLNEYIIGYPLEVTTKNFYSKEAKEAATIAKVLLDAKFVMQQGAIQASVDETNNETEQGK